METDLIGDFKRTLGHLKASLEEFLGEEITEEALQRAIRVYNETRALLRKLYELRKADAPPITGAETLDVILADERHRIAWFGGYPFFFTKITDWVEENFKAVVVGDGLSLVESAPIEEVSDPLECLARKDIGASYWRVTRSSCHYAHYAEDLGRLSQESRIDGVVFFASLGCKQNGGQMRMYQDVWRDKLGIPHPHPGWGCDGPPGGLRRADEGQVEGILQPAG